MSTLLFTRFLTLLLFLRLPSRAESCLRSRAQRPQRPLHQPQHQRAKLQNQSQKLLKSTGEMTLLLLLMQKQQQLLPQQQLMQGKSTGETIMAAKRARERERRTSATPRAAALSSSTLRRVRLIGLVYVSSEREK